MTRDFASELEELRRDYGVGLPSKLAELEGYLDDARAGRNSVDTARAVAHRLRGTAGSYGFVEVSKLLEIVEEALSGPSATSPDWEAIDRLMQRARAQAEKTG